MHIFRTQKIKFRDRFLKARKYNFRILTQTYQDTWTIYVSFNIILTNIFCTFVLIHKYIINKSHISLQYLIEPFQFINIKDDYQGITFKN